MATYSSRRRFITATAWTAPALVVVTATPTLAMSTRGFSVLFNQALAGSDGFVQQSYLNLGMQPGTSAFTLPASMTVYFQVVGLNTRTVDERSFTASSSDGTVTKLAYDPTTRTTRFSWVIPAGTRIPSLSTSNPGTPLTPMSRSTGATDSRRTAASPTRSSSPGSAGPRVLCRSPGTAIGRPDRRVHRSTPPSSATSPPATGSTERRRSHGPAFGRIGLSYRYSASPTSGAHVPAVTSASIARQASTSPAGTAKRWVTVSAHVLSATVHPACSARRCACAAWA